MTPKRVNPSFTSFPCVENSFDRPFDQDLSEYECFRKRVKKDSYCCEQKNTEEDHPFNEFTQQPDENIQNANLFGQEFELLRACSFKTISISKIGQDKTHSFNKIQMSQFDDKYSSANRKRRQSFNHLSEERSKNKETISMSRSRHGRKNQVCFGSMNEISLLQKKSSHDTVRINGFIDKMKKRESSYSGIGSGSLNSINTTMMNQIIDFTIHDENQIDQIYLTKMMETALIKNVKFTGNLFIRFTHKKSEEKFYSNVKTYKLLGDDGFSITGFYADGQKIHINLNKSITNKEFQKKFVLQPSIHSQSQKSKQQFTKQHGVEFSGFWYDFSTFEWEEIKLFISDIKDNVKNSILHNDEIENVNFQNWMIPQDSFDSNFAVGHFPFGNTKHQRHQK